MKPDVTDTAPGVGWGRLREPDSVDRAVGTTQTDCTCGDDAKDDVVEFDSDVAEALLVTGTGAGMTAVVARLVVEDDDVVSIESAMVVVVMGVRRPCTRGCAVNQQSEV